MADHAMPLQVKHKLRTYTVSEMVGEWETEFSFLSAQSRGLPH